MINEHFTPFFGFVEDVFDDTKAGRIKVRVCGYNADQSIVPTENLVWFNTGVNNSSFLGGKGQSPTGYANGTLVFGYYISEDRMEGIVICSFGSASDVSPIAKGESDPRIEVDTTVETWNTADGNEITEPESYRNTVYPNNRVLDTDSGHLQEFDDSEGAERINTRHTSGSRQEFLPDGSVVNKIVKDNYTVIAGDDNLYVKGNVNITCDEHVSILCTSAKIKAETTIEAECGSLTSKSNTAVIDSPNTTMTGDVDIAGNLNVEGTSVASDHISDGISGKSHQHTSAAPGSPTSAPIP